MHFQNRHDVIEYAIVNISSHYRTVIRALSEGPIEFLGGFSHIPPSSYPGWVIRAQSKISKTNYYIAIVNIGLNILTINLINEVPWKYWDGDKINDPLYRGDCPKIYQERKNAKTKE